MKRAPIWQRQESSEAFFAAVAKISERRVGHFSAQKLTNAAWAFATFFVAVAKFLDWHWGQFSAQELANTAWAFATANNTEIG